MVYIIMADGLGTRWQNYLDKPKHLIEINGETLLARTVRLLKAYSPNCTVYITTHNPNYATKGATLYEPKHNSLEIDRFTSELINDNICFLYGDTYYSEDAIKKIVDAVVDEIMFFATEKSIVAIKIKNGDMFRFHVNRVRELYIQGKISKCIGWQVYQSINNLPFGDKTPCDNLVLLADGTNDINTPQEYMDNNQINIEN